MFIWSIFDYITHLHTYNFNLLSFLIHKIFLKRGYTCIDLFIYYTGKLLLKDPRLAFSIFFGPLTPQQYRVIGHGQWQGAREEILYTHKMYERNYNSLCIKPVGFSKKFNPRRILLKICFYLFILIVLVHYFFLLLY